jgi:crotonobetainyl-CoA:carnitine CoA-transferase CaiB-like acyl-CoA transferase
MLLGDLGADVIRVESPEGSDSMREWGPFVNGQSTYYLSSNRNKRSITLDLKKVKGKALFLELVKQADVVVENFKTGTMKRLGLDYEELKKVNNQIIMCSVTGFGQTGPLSEEPGFDPIVQALSGLMDVTGEKDGDGMRVGIPISDILTSNYVVISILAALRMRDLNQKGQHIDLSLLDVQMSSLANVSNSYLNTGVSPKRVGNSHISVVPYQVFKCKDDPIMLAIGNNRLFEKFCRVVNRPEWAVDSRYATNEVRLDNEEEFVEKVAAVIREKTADEWLDLFHKEKIPTGKVNTVEQAFEEPQVKARGVVEEIADAKYGKIKVTKNPLRFSELNISTRLSPPELGEHTEEILMKDLKLEEADIESLRQDGIIA